MVAVRVPSLHIATPFVLLLASASWPALHATDLLHNGGWPTGSDCVDQAWNSDQVYVYQCHGEPNQQWELTADDQIRSAEGNCLEYFDDQDKVAGVKCDTGRRQKWYLANGLLKPQGFRLPTGAWFMRVGMCLDSAQPDGKLMLHGCHGATNQKFSASFLPTTTMDDIVQVDGTWATNGNCLDYDYSAGFAYVYACHGQWNQRWHFTVDDEIRVSGSSELCLEYDAKDQALVRACSKAENQKWVVLDDGHVQPKASPTKCLDASYSTSKLALAACVADKPNQKFRSSVLKPKFRDVLKVKGPWADAESCVDYAWGSEYAHIYSCHGQANQLWELTNDEQIRTTENKCLEFDGDGLLRVAVKPCDSQRATQKWFTKASGAITPRGYFDSTGTWRVPNKCIDAALEDKKLQLWDCVDESLNQKFRSSAWPTRSRDFVFADGASSTPGFNCLRSLDSLVLVAKCSATREMLWELKADGSLALDVNGGVCLTASSGGASGRVEASKCTGAASQKWERTSSGGISLQAGAAGWGKCLDWKTTPTLALVDCVAGAATQTFSSSVFKSVASTSLNGLYEKATLLSAKIKTDTFLTSSVLTSASAVVKEAERVLSSNVKTDAQRATDFLVQFLTKSDNTSDLSVQPRALYITSESEEFLAMLSMLLQTTEGGSTSVLEAIAPAIRVFSDQLFDARYEVLLDHVVRGDVNRVEAYADGTLSDFDAVGGMLTAVCGRLGSSSAAATAAASMCRLSSYFSLIDQFFQLKYRLLVEGPRAISAASLAMARTVSQTFKSNQALLTSDPLWKRLMTLLVFGAPYVDVLPETTLAHASRGDSYLTTFVLYAVLGNDKFLEELTPMVRFLSDQITTFHVNNVLSLTTSKDIDGLEAYMAEPVNTYSVLTDTSTTSDFSTVAQYIVPLVCGDPAREQLSLCQLDQVHMGLQTVLRFERSRRSNVVSLDDVVEVDVRKKLDVIDQEKKQFEMISTLQKVANQIGSTLLKGMADLKTQIATSTAAIRSDIEATRQDIRQAIGDVGQKLQTSIDQSTDLLYNQVGQQAASIRRDIFDSSQRLEQRLDDTGRAILGSIEESKQELKYQIGAEAERTREHITTKSGELKEHMTKETQGLREFIDIKTNQVIGVVREEGASTREEVNKATNQIVREVQKEGAITRAYVDTKTNEVKEVVRSESAKTREFVDASTKQVIGVVQEEGRTTRAFVDEKGNQVIGVVKEEGEKTRTEVRAEGQKIREHIDIKTNEIVGVVRDEGAKTRSDVNARAAELKEHVTNQATVVVDQVKKSQEEMQKQSAAQFSELSEDVKEVGEGSALSKEAVAAIAGISAAGCVNMWAKDTPFSKIRREYMTAVASLSNTITYLQPLHDEVEQAIGKYLTRQTSETAPYIYATALPWSFKVLRSIVAMLKFEFDRVLAFPDVNTWLAVAEFDHFLTTIQGMATKKQSLAAKHPEEWKNFKRMLNGENDIEFVTPRYDNFKLDAQAMHVQSFEGPFSFSSRPVTAFSTINTAGDIYRKSCEIFDIEEVYGESVSDACYDMWDVYSELTEELDDAFAAFEKLRLAYVQYVVPNMRCTSAKKAQAWAAGEKDATSKRLRRGLQVATSGNANEPFYAMTFTVLTTILLDYRLQEAAHQFCKYYEFRGGGVAPPMCGTSSAYYTLSQIQEMRSWQPPTYQRTTTRVLLPTSLAWQAEAGTTRVYPFVDLERLARGKPVTFELPTWDLEWLKRYRWVPANAKESTLSTYYVESMRLYLPFQATGNTASAGGVSTPFAVTTFMQPSLEQFASWQQRDTQRFQLSQQPLKFDTAYDEPFCAEASKTTNPYHVMAGCVATTGRSSQICVRQNGVESSARLLPNLLSNWRINADFDVNSTRFKLVQPPRNASVLSEEFVLFADVTLVEVSSTGTKSAINSVRGSEESMTLNAAVADSCCALDEFRSLQSGACVKCATNTTSALNGYTCVLK